MTVTINSIDYPITFEANNAETVTIPYVSTPPTAITVKSADISAKATGLAAGDTLKISSGKADITITAEDGTTTAYTLSIAINPPPIELTNQELGDKWGLFQVVLDEEDTLYHFGVIPAGEQVPEKSEMESDLNVKKYIVGRNPINIILATTMKSPLLPFFDAVTDDAPARAIWTDTDVSFNGANIMTGDNEFAAKRSLLAPETAHKVYVLEDGGNSVYIIHEFTTTAVDLTTASSTLDILSATLQAKTLTFHADNYEVFPLQMKASLASDTALLPQGTGPKPSWLSASPVYWSHNNLALNPSFFPKDNRPEFYFYAGEAADYGNSPRLLSLRGFFMTIKKGTNADPRFSAVSDSYHSRRHPIHLQH